MKDTLFVGSDESKVLAYLNRVLSLEDCGHLLISAADRKIEIIDLEGCGIGDEIKKVVMWGLDDEPELFSPFDTVEIVQANGHITQTTKIDVAEYLEAEIRVAA